MNTIQNSKYTLVDLLNQRASDTPDKLAFRFLIDEAHNDETITYSELMFKAKQVAHTLQHSTNPGDRALLLYPAGLEYIIGFLGCLYAGVIAVPAYPARNRHYLKRLATMIEDASPQVVLGSDAIFKQMTKLADYNHTFEGVTQIITDVLPEVACEEFLNLPAVSSEKVAFLQYTSGSTGSPKGVMVTHKNIMANLKAMSAVIKCDEIQSGVSWLPPYHDMGLIGGILQPIYSEFVMTIMAPNAFLQNPIRWFRAISKYKAEVSVGPNFAYKYCVDKIDLAQCEDIDLSSWKSAVNGAEPISCEVLEAFRDKFAPIGFHATTAYPCYGMAEFTLIATGIARDEEPEVSHFKKDSLKQLKAIEIDKNHTPAERTALVSCGRVIPGHEILIVDPKTKIPCSKDHVGEIWLKGPSAAIGYWNNAERTEETFNAKLNDGHGPYLRTGDLGFLHNDSLYVAGRLKDVIIIRGCNYYPQDIEECVFKSHKGLKNSCCAAFSVKVNNEEQLVVVAELERAFRKHHPDDFFHVINRAVSAEFGLRPYAIVLLKPGRILKTTSGKIQRQASKSAYLNKELEAIATWTIEDGLASENYVELNTTAPSNARPEFSALRAYIQHLLSKQLKVPTGQIDPSLPVADYGLDSIMAVELTEHLSSNLKCELDPSILWDQATVDSLANIILCQMDEKGAKMSEVLACVAQASAQETEVSKLHDKPKANLKDFCDFTAFPEYKKLMGLREQVDPLGVSRLYFSANEGVSRDTMQMDGETYINFSGYNYLGMSGDPEVNQGAIDAVNQYGTSVSASRIVSGEKPVHRDLEAEISNLIGTDDCIVLTTGHATNVTTISHLMGKDDLIIYDALAHNSIIEGALASGASRLMFPHNDWQALDRLLQQHRTKYNRVLVAIEGVYSMDGDMPDVPEFIRVKKKHHALLMIDEAHSIGVLGKTGAGAREHFDVNAADVDIWMGTLSKAFASCGGYIAGSKALIEYLKFTAPGFVYSVGIPPANAGAALAAISLMYKEPERLKALQDRSALFVKLLKEAGLNTGQSAGTPVVPVITGNSAKSIKMSQALYEKGIVAHPIFYPAVEENASRLRFFINATHTEAQIRQTAACVIDCDKEVSDEAISLDEIS